MSASNAQLESIVQVVYLNQMEIVMLEFSALSVRIFRQLQAIMHLVTIPLVAVLLVIIVRLELSTQHLAQLALSTTPLAKTKSQTVLLVQEVIIAMNWVSPPQLSRPETRSVILDITATQNRLLPILLDHCKQ